jgi:hypothetical protein
MIDLRSVADLQNHELRPLGDAGRSAISAE